MRIRDRKAIWLKQLYEMSPVQVAAELAKLEREVERKNEDVGYLSKIHSRTEDDWRRYHNRKVGELTKLLREKEKRIEKLLELLQEHYDD